MATYYEIIIKGDDELARAYVEGYFLGRGIKHGYEFGEDEALDLSHMRDLIKYHGSVLHMICESSLRGDLKRAVRQAPEDYEFEIVETRLIQRASFRFKFFTANRRVAGQIKRIISTLPEGVRTTDYDPKEIVDPSARGAEVYAPTHAYEFKGKGVIEGTPDAVYDVHARMEDHQHVTVNDIVLVFK